MADIGDIIGSIGIDKIGMSIMNVIFFSVLFIIILGILLFFALWFWKRPKYNVIVEVHSERYEKSKPFFTKGARRFNKKVGVWEFLVKGFKKKWPLPDSRYFTTDVKGRDVIYLYYKNGELLPIKPPTLQISDNTKLKIIEGDVQLWSSTRKENTDQIFQTFKAKLLQYLPQILNIVAMVLFLIFAIQLVKEMQVLQPIASEFRKAAEALQVCRAVTVPSPAP